MIKLLSSLRLHLIFIVLTQILYTLVDLFRPDTLDSYWIFFYTGICIFIYLAAGWVVMYEIGKRLTAAIAGLLVFIVGYLTQLIGLFLFIPWVHGKAMPNIGSALLKFIHYGLYYALIAMALAVVGAHICNQYKRHQKEKQHVT
ncbi:MAG: hypothetical protein ACK4PR_00970 [Gammaproteobacteria bacterium]